MHIDIQFNDRPIGAEVRGIDLRTIDDHQFALLRQLLHERGMIVVKDQALHETQQIEFARRFGQLQKIFLKDALSSRYPELFLVSNIIENGRPIGSTDAGRFWHTDGAYLAKPHSVSMLYAIEVPEEGGKALGDTDFASMGAAFEALPQERQQLVAQLRGVHSLHYRYSTKGDAAAEMARMTEQFPPVSHPLAIVHPVTGRRCLYLSEGYTTGIEGLPPAEGRALLEELCAHVLRPEFRHRHAWSRGDLLIWDNLATLHHANFDYALPQRRLMRRATVAGEALG
jgi:taurine dioxygenase